MSDRAALVLGRHRIDRMAFRIEPVGATIGYESGQRVHSSPQQHEYRKFW